MKTNEPEEDQLIIRTVKEYAEKRLSGVNQEIDALGQWPAETLREMKAMGLFGIIIPDVFGGTFKSYHLYYRILYEIAKICVSHALILLSHSFCSHMIYSNGTDEQKDKWLSKMAAGDFLGAVAMTEPDAGSDLAAVRTTIVPKEGGYLLNGHKQFITNGNKADLIVVLVSTSSSQKNPIFNKRLVVVEKPIAGFSTGKSENKMGFRGSDTSELYFDNVMLDKQALLGREGQGILSIMKGLQYSRLAMASIAIGVADSAHEEGIKYARQRKQYGKPISDLQAIQQYLADNETELECAKLLLNNAASRQDQGDASPSYTAMAKYYCSETALRVVTRVMQIHGAYGYIKEFPIERHYRDVRLCTIIEGSSEVLRSLISKNVCASRAATMK